ncbi:MULTISPECIES: hypothetical protein [unclassified Novosphingobium]|uniref:hypothetical protein n=1 Tax=unclassified Novosphingobium TaxID=2644732 RepID=UPI00135B4BE8|nr:MULTISPECIES: hypothetical protein [unclassified Novosphingobium]
MKAPSDHVSEIGLLTFIAGGVFIAMCIGIWRATADHSFDPSAYLVVLTLIVGAIKERWTQRSVDRMGASLANSPPADPAAKEPAL